ncbi:hypothetical protein [Paractinoplanes rishiriensis]|uniref:Uncharacterized protein n=1 Tax=Paractinoplanes rishiriensis TaxID=1050105 RepID=A0A919K5G2_9ACTN|nr:hypothetical protein [Actinoplanes rishiriensis]GIE99944.1 hypothetical protein Ari01nite_74090 [Actinoplanes rishiriensis]
MRTVSRRFALWRADLEGGVCAAPEECVDALRERAAVPVVLEHPPARLPFDSALHQDVEWQFTGVPWPPGLHPGTLVTVSWQPARDEVVVRTARLDEPVQVDGVAYFHEYDPRVVTREFVPDGSNRGQVLHAVRKRGRVFDDGSAVLPEAGLAAHCGLGRGARGSFLLRNAVDQLIREGFLTRVPGSVDSSGYPAYPAVDGQKPAEMLFYAPLVEPVPDPDDESRPEHLVHSFVRKLPRGAHASEKQVTLHQQAVASEEIETSSLEPGYTFVKRHHRGT